MKNWTPTQEYEQVVAANIAEHAEIAIEYEARTRQLASNPKLRKHWYFDHLRMALHEIRSRFPGQNLLALDAGGGTGKTALFLQLDGVKVVLCDVSSEMVAIYRKICSEKGLEAIMSWMNWRTI